MKELVFIVNPRSGVDRVKDIEQMVAQQFDPEQFHCLIRHTEYAGHGTGIAREAADRGADVVIAVGGDGSVNDIAKGLLGTGTALAIVPKGSGNGMARTLGIPLDGRKALAVIRKGNSIRMDIGFANERAFISNAGVGFDTVIAEAFAQSNTRGLRAYSWLVTKHLWQYRASRWEITVDGESFSERAFMITVANGRQFGYNFRIAPEASWTDGMLDLIIIKPFPRLLGAGLVLRALNGNILKSPWVRHFRGGNIRIHRPGLNMMQTDGDAHPCPDTITFTVRPGALPVIVP